MAGPGGGPPRKSHTKSRKGCKTCKRRHIRCDEQYPQCRNCTKHSCRCDYQDQPPPMDEMPKMPAGPNLLWTPQIEAEVDNWIRTGIFPFPEMGLTYDQQFLPLQKVERRLIHHIGSIYRDLFSKNLLNCSIWLEKVPLFFDLAYGNEFVLHAILAFSATNLASETRSMETSNLAYQHRGTALQGLHASINNFSESNSDSILAASLLLSWQAADWKGWLSLMHGITSVLSSMTAWKDVSLLANFVERYVQSSTSEIYVPMGMGRMGAPILPEDDPSLHESVAALDKLQFYVAQDPVLHNFVPAVLRQAQEIETSSSIMQHDQLFIKLQALRMQTLWSPIHLLKTMDHSNYNLLTVANLYATAMAIDISIPELSGAAFGALTIEPVLAIDNKLRYSTSPNFDSPGAVDDLMQFPRLVMGRTRHKRGSLDSTTSHARQGSPYSFQNSGPTTPAFPPVYPNWMQNLSTEDLTNLSVPPSPFLDPYLQQNSRPHSALLAHHSRPNSLSFDRRSFSAFSGIGPGGESPSYSPAVYSPAANSPVPSVYLEDDTASYYSEHTGAWNGNNAFPPFDNPHDRNKSISWQGTPPPQGPM